MSYHCYTNLLKALLFSIGFSVLFPLQSFAQTYTLSGRVLSTKKAPVEAAVVLLTQSDQWAMTDAKGDFAIQNVNKGKIQVVISCLGYVTATHEIEIHSDTTDLKFYLEQNSLMLDDVEITAKVNENSATTSRTIDRTAMDHMQMVNVSDLMALMPGGKTINPNLTTSPRFEIRTGGESGASFGTAVEVDGVRLSNNAVFNETAGASTRNLSSANVESVEVISGVPSVEYGDMSNGIVKINTRKGKSPWQVSFSTNPRTKQYALNKGLELGETAGILNFSLERTKSITNLASPYSSYDRNTLSLIYSNTFRRSERPIRFTFGLTGNVGGSDTKADPDAALNSYSKVRDNTIRSNFTLNWLADKPWLTNVDLSASISYSDRLSENYARKSAASSVAAQHGTEEGYFVATEYDVDPNAAITLIPAGIWYERAFTDNKPLDYNIHLKANWSRRFGKVQNRIKLGANFTSSGNLGRGLYLL